VKKTVRKSKKEAIKIALQEAIPPTETSRIHSHRTRLGRQKTLWQFIQRSNATMTASNLERQEVMDMNTLQEEE